MGESPREFEPRRYQTFFFSEGTYIYYGTIIESIHHNFTKLQKSYPELSNRDYQYKS